MMLNINFEMACKMQNFRPRSHVLCLNVDYTFGWAGCVKDDEFQKNSFFPPKKKEKKTPNSMMLSKYPDQSIGWVSFFVWVLFIKAKVGFCMVIMGKYEVECDVCYFFLFCLLVF